MFSRLIDTDFTADVAVFSTDSERLRCGPRCLSQIRISDALRSMRSDSVLFSITMPYSILPCLSRDFHVCGLNGSLAFCISHILISALTVIALSSIIIYTFLLS